MAGNLGELFIELGTIGDTQELKTFVKKVREGAEAIEKQMNAQEKNNKSLKSFMVKLAGVVTAISGAAYAINRLTNDLVKNNQAFINLTRQSDIALSTFQKWDSIGKMFGIENAAGQLENLNERLFELRLTGEGARGFQLAGINPIGQDAQGVLEQLRSRIQGMDNTTAGYLLKQMGLDPRMISLLRMSREEFEELGRTMKQYQLTDGQRQQIERMNIQLQIASQKLQYLRDRALLKLMPYWVKFLQSLARVAEGLARAVNWLTGTKKGVIALAAAITSVLIPAVKGLLAIFTAHPVMAALTAILGSLYLIIDDIVGYFQGKDSVLGLVMNFLDELDEKLNSIQTPKWIQNLLAIIQGSGNILAVLDAGKNAAKGEPQKLDAKKIIRNFIPLVPGLGFTAPFVRSSQTVEALTDWAKLLDNQPVSDSLSFATPAMNQSIDKSNTTSNSNTTIAMTNYIDTEQPAQSIDRELRFTMASLAYS